MIPDPFPEYADKAAARYLEGRMDEQAAWVEAVTEMWDDYADSPGTDALDALLRRMGVE